MSDGTDAPGNEVVALLEREITERGLGPGAKLPTERELAERLGVGRSAVRRSLASLESEGRVVRHVGRGTFLAAVPDGDGRADTSPAEVMAVRLLLEPQMLALAVASATPSDLGRMEHCLAESEAAPGFEEFELWDAAFHRAVAEATHNRFLVRIFATMSAVRQEPLWGGLKRRGFTPARRADYDADHREILAALRERDAERAQAAMRHHLARVRANLLGTADG